MSTTPPGPPPGPPPAPPPGPPSGPPSTAPQPAAAPPKKKSGGGIWLVLFVVAAVLFVGALVFAIISFTGRTARPTTRKGPAGAGVDEVGAGKHPDRSRVIAAVRTDAQRAAHAGGLGRRHPEIVHRFQRQSPRGDDRSDQRRAERRHHQRPYRCSESTDRWQPRQLLDF